MCNYLSYFGQLLCCIVFLGLINTLLHQHCAVVAFVLFFIYSSSIILLLYINSLYCRFFVDGSKIKTKENENHFPSWRQFLTLQDQKKKKEKKRKENVIEFSNGQSSNWNSKEVDFPQCFYLCSTVQKSQALPRLFPRRISSFSNIYLIVRDFPSKPETNEHSLVRSKRIHTLCDSFPSRCSSTCSLTPPLTLMTF